MLNNATGFDRIYIACGYTDLRQGIDGLCAVIRRQLDIDPFQKNVLFMFCAGNRIKSSASYGKVTDSCCSISGFWMANTNGPGQNRRSWK
ncbi:MAG: IS66 family insertion sequence element accessory protein TnpB [Oscillospiraceae bacterium]|nr:IS66 family insertion sequence element accessory protein TnpB [Oscillospiraceae bacterium]